MLPDAAILTIFGITGDLAHRKLLPAVYDLAQDGKLPEAFRIVGITRRGTTPGEVIARIDQAIQRQGRQCDRAILERIEQAIAIITMDITNEVEYVRLKQELDQIETDNGACMQRLFYLAIPAQMFGPIVRHLGASGLNTGCQHNRAESRLLIEKPFGYDLASAQELFENIATCFTDQQLYLIDHYLAKPAVEQILDFRFTDARLEPFWNTQHIDHIVITADEVLGIEGRATFYEEVGALRDLIQSHLMQVLSLVMMDQPADRTASAIHAAKQQLLQAVRPPAEDAMSQCSVRGQYENYRQEVNNPRSAVETFAAVVLHCNNERWQGVPVLLRTGKGLALKRTAVEVLFRPGQAPQEGDRLTINIEPEATITLGVVTHSRQTLAGPPANTMDAYERVIIDAMHGDKRLFASREEVLASWHIVDPILESWANNRVPLQIYPSGSRCPQVENIVAGLEKCRPK